MQAHEMSSLTHVDSAWPPEVGLILSALEAGAFDGDQRQQPRRPYRVKAMLRLFIDPPGASPWQLFTRDASPRGLGFISHHMLPLSHGGIVELLGPQWPGNPRPLHASPLPRSQPRLDGWRAPLQPRTMVFRRAPGPTRPAQRRIRIRGIGPG